MTEQKQAELTLGERRYLERVRIRVSTGLTIRESFRHGGGTVCATACHLLILMVAVWAFAVDMPLADCSNAPRVIMLKLATAQLGSSFSVSVGDGCNEDRVAFDSSVVGPDPRRASAVPAARLEPSIECRSGYRGSNMSIGLTNRATFG